MHLNGVRNIANVDSNLFFNIYLFIARDHRIHHKYAETDADPHNSNRGFFFAHIGWALLKKHPDVAKQGLKLDLKDLYEDSVLMFHRRHYIKMGLILHILLPTIIPAIYWGENWWTALVICVMTRHAYTLNMTFLINSWAHMGSSSFFGNRQYDKRIAPVECSVRHWLFGEGYVCTIYNLGDQIVNNFYYYY